MNANGKDKMNGNANGKSMVMIELIILLMVKWTAKVKWMAVSKWMTMVMIKWVVKVMINQW